MAGVCQRSSAATHQSSAGDPSHGTTDPVADALARQAHQVSHRHEYEADAHGFALARQLGATLDDAVKFNIYLTDLGHFAKVNEIMARYFHQPYPARAAVGVKELPRGALIEADAILVKRGG